MTGLLDAALSFVSSLAGFYSGPAEIKKKGQVDNSLPRGTPQHINAASSHSSFMFCLHTIAQHEVNAGNKKCWYSSSWSC